MAVARTLRGVQPQVERETAATRAAWPLILAGIPGHLGAGARARILTAAGAAQALPLPAQLSERRALQLTGPGSPLAGRYRDFQLLCSASWRQLVASLQEIERGPQRAATFARANVALYVEGIYDAHYSLGEAGKQLLEAYESLGGPAVLGRALSRAEVTQLADTFSPARERLSPHERVKLGS